MLTILLMSDFVAARKRFYTPSRGLPLCISASKHCSKIQNTHSSNTSKQNLLILSCLSDFMTCRERFNIQSEASISQLWNTVGRLCSSETHVHKV